MRARAGLLAGLAAGALLVGGCGPSGSTTSTAVATTAPVSTTAGPLPSTSETASPSSSTTTTDPATSTATTTPPAPTTAPAAPPPAPAYLLTSGASSDKVRELQARLKQLDWYAGAISGSYDATTTEGVRGFQDKRDLAVSGSVDQATWDALAGMTSAPTSDEMNNRLTPGPALLKSGASGAAVRDLQARLKQIGWWSGDVVDGYGASTVAAVKAFQDKRLIPVTGEVDQRTLDKLTAMTRKPTSDELNNVKPAPAPVTTTGLDPRCTTGHVLCISRATRSLTWVVDGQAQASMAVRFGSVANPTRNGVFSVFSKYRYVVSSIYGSPMPYSMCFDGGRCVHYSADFAARGYAGASHGCVNVRDLAGIAALFDQVQIGDRVVVY